MIRITSVAALLCCASMTARVHAQDGPAYVGGSFLVSGNSTTFDPPGAPNFLRPNFHGSLDGPVTGLKIDGGAFVAHHWDLRGELSFRRAEVANITEDEQSGHTEFRHLSSSYKSSEHVLSILTGRRIRASSKVDVHPVGGFNMSFATQKLTERHGTLSFGNGTLPINGPDVSVQSTSYGFGGGADVVIGTSAPVAFVGGMRLLWFHRSATEPSHDRIVPSMGAYEMTFAAGVRWRARSR